MAPPRSQATDLNPDDKVLILGIPDPDFVREAAARLTAGILVAIGDGESVRAARRQFRELVNVMFMPGSPHEIPWHDRFFTKVIDTRAGEWPNPDRVAAEILRVLAAKP
jgi:hypothetical protein